MEAQTHQTQFDVGPLNWVRNEIDLALGRAEQELAKFVHSRELTQLKFCRTHLHQVQGALTIVGLDGVTQFAEAVEALLDAIEQQKLAVDDVAIALVRRSLAAIGFYLGELIGGAPNQPLRLLSLYREVQQARGVERFAASDLFFPDLGVPPPARPARTRALTHGELQALLRHERPRFQRGFLAWLRAPNEGAGIGEMRDALRRIEETQETASARAFWWVAGSLLGALGEGALPADADAKQLCARIDLQIRRLFEGSRNVAERLLRDALYLVARADAGSDAVRAVRAAYRLQDLVPTSSAPAPAAREAVERRLREFVAATEEAWSRYCLGTGQALPAFTQNAQALSAVADEMGNTDFRRLTQAIAAAGNWLADDSTRHADALAMEVATAILLAQSIQDDLRRLGGDFAHQVDVTVARIHGCLAGHPPQPGSEIPLLDEMSRRAQEKLLVSQVAKEIQSNLGQIEQVLDGFFRDADKRSELISLDAPLNQVAGALAIMRHDGAVAAVRECTEQIRRFAAADYVPQPDDFERVANQLSLIGFFIDALAHGATDYASFVRQMQAPTVAPAEQAQTDAASVEQELARHKEEAHALLGALKEQPQSQPLRDAVKHSLASIKSDADLLADRALGEQAKAALSMLEQGDAAALSIDRAMTALKPETAEQLAPSQQTVSLAQGSSEQIDAELLGIFLEEAHEVLRSVEENLALLRETPRSELLTPIRRAFHTLKGSGRMVGLRDLGESAWEIEQTLNLWLRQEFDVGKPVIELLELAHAVFAAWVGHLEQGSSSAPDATRLQALARALRGGHEDGGPSAAPSAQPPVAEVRIEEISAEEPPGEEAPAEEAGAEEVPLASAQIISFPAPTSGAAAECAPVGAEVGVEAGATASHAGETQMRITLSPTLYDIFSDEARAHLATLQGQLALLRSDPATPTPHEMYRAAHTLAGISATVGISAVNRLGGALEHALLRRDASPQAGSVSALEVVERSVDELAAMLARLAEKGELEGRQHLIVELEALYPAAHVGEVREVTEAPEVPEVPEVAPVSGDVKALADEIDEQLLPIFLEEALDLSQGISAALRAWRAAPADGETVATLRRLLHTLKGSARMAGAMNLGEIAHAIETRVERAHGVGSVATEVIDEIDGAFDAVLHIVERIQGGESLALPLPEQAPVASGEAAVPLPVVERRAEGGRQGEPAEGDAASRATLRVRADLIDRLVNEAGELSIARARIEGEMRALKGSLLDLTENVIRLRHQLREIEIQSESQMQSRSVQADAHPAGFDPLEFDRFTRFQELARMMAESVNDVATVQQSLLKNLDDANAAILAQSRLNRDLQQQLMGVRMVPFGTLADRLYRTVRQTSKAVGKRANLEISGGQVELDRSVLDKIGAPLEHLLRNAIVHGIEPRETRLERNKPAIGELALTLKQEGNEIIVTLSDDGAGLDFERIRARAVAAGLLAAPDEIGEIKETDRERLAALIFAPGFSTASEVSQDAGRGVGTDVVKTEIMRLGGRIEVASIPGKGCEFRLYLPLTLALTKALLVRAGGRSYAIPSVMIEQVLDLKEAALAPIRDAASVEWMGHRYPFHYLPHLLGEAQASPERRRQYWILLLTSANRRLSVLVDEMLGNEEIVVKNIGPQLARVIGIDGATVLASGQVVLIVNPVALSTRAPLTTPAAVLPEPPVRVEHGAQPPTVMVVDDSLTVRKITSRLLAREGYQVLSAKDGVDALEKLLDVVPDVMLVDIEMPRMDGFDLTRNVRADARLKDVPIVMITSRIAEKHRAYAFEIGVNDYLGKPYQEDELLRLIDLYVKARHLPAPA